MQSRSNPAVGKVMLSDMDAKGNTNTRCFQPGLVHELRRTLSAESGVLARLILSGAHSPPE
jgi:hypothetical protein